MADDVDISDLPAPPPEASTSRDISDLPVPAPSEEDYAAAHTQADLDALRAREQAAYKGAGGGIHPLTALNTMGNVASDYLTGVENSAIRLGTGLYNKLGGDTTPAAVEAGLTKVLGPRPAQDPNAAAVEQGLTTSMPAQAISSTIKKIDELAGQVSPEFQAHLRKVAGVGGD